MEDGKYLRGYDGHALSRAATRGGRLELPTTVGAIATVTVEVPDETKVRFIILEATPESREILSTGAIGPYACPEESIYYTVGTPGQVTVMNHMEADIYATISGETGGGLQRKGSPGNLLTWGCDKDEAAHVSMAGSLDGQAGQVFTAYRGKILHIQKMPSEPVWQGESMRDLWDYTWRLILPLRRRFVWTGIKSVPVEAAKYSPQEPGMEGKIVVQNDLAFYIYVAVLCSVLGEGAEDLKWTRQFALKPGGKDSSSRTNPEVVFVSVGSSPGVPRAFIGRPGFILHIDTPH
ncbi:hypothetical protein D9611_013848 [Ephemerocybe angulata]|uniref:Uncharacterized protein n=1 Tax=Ephemerocybe angulata TaxID=980116 RepID=A0A8H5BTE7_9AGAR|nr:hypothetical protein D9611_013848 [Tulosesus angulatus]